MDTNIKENNIKMSEFNDEQIISLKKYKIENISNILKSSTIFNNLESFEMFNPVGDIMRGKKIVYGKLCSFNEKIIFPYIDFDICIFVTSENTKGIYAKEINSIKRKIKKLCTGKQKIKYGENALINGSPYYVIVFLKKNTTNEDLDLIANSSYICPICGNEGIKYLDRHRCKECGAQVIYAKRVGTSILNNLRTGFRHVSYIENNKIDVTKIKRDHLFIRIVNEALKSVESVRISGTGYWNNALKGTNLSDLLIDFYVKEFNKYYEYHDSPKYIKEVKVVDLFGYHSYKLSFDYKNKLSIIYGTNGLGKTTILKILEYLLINKKDTSYYTEAILFLRKVPFLKFSIFFADNSKIIVSKNKTINFKYIDLNGTTLDNWNYTEDSPVVFFENHYINVERLSPKVNNENRFLSIEINRTKNYDDIKMYKNDTKKSSKINNLDESMKDSDIENITDFEFYFMKLYCKYRQDLLEAKNGIGYPIRLFNTRFNNYDYVINSFNYVKNSIISDEIIKNFDIKIVDKGDYTYESIIKTINGLSDLVSKYILFKETFESFYYKYDPTQKKIGFDDKTGQIYIKAKENIKDKDFKVRLSFSQLSSGELNIANILFNIIFKATTDSIVLIDEPEVSLHIAWQQKFGDVITSLIEDKNNMQVIVASHSPFIASGREELMLEPKLLSKRERNENE